MDGFVTRRPQRTNLTSASSHQARTTIGHERRVDNITSQLHTGDDTSVQMKNPTSGGIRDSISSSLEAIDQNTPKTPHQKRKKSRKKKRIIKISSIIIGIIVLIVGGFLVYKALGMMGNVLDGNPFDIFQQQALKEDAYGRSNILIVGTTDDDPTRKAEGDGILTDSMMILSVNQTTKDAYMFSIPRDLYVKYGRACNSGYAGKINEYFNCVNEDRESDEAETQRQTKSREFFGDLLG